MSTLPGVVSCQTTLMLPLTSTEMSGSDEKPVLLERFFDLENVAPPSVERLKKMSRLPAGLSSQTTSMLPLASATICALNEKPELLDPLFGVEKAAPPSVERVRKMTGLGSGEA